MSVRGVSALAIGSLWGKKGRNLLTMSGVTIGVFALTMIIALGQGLRKVITDTVASDGNLRQIRMMGGTGVQQSSPDDEIEINSHIRTSASFRVCLAQISGRV